MYKHIINQTKKTILLVVIIILICLFNTKLSLAITIILKSDEKFKATYIADEKFKIIRNNKEEIINLSQIKSILFEDITVKRNENYKNDNSNKNYILSSNENICNLPSNITEKYSIYTIKHHETYILNEDSSYDIITHKIIKFFKKNTKNYQISMTYDTDREKIDILYVKVFDNNKLICEADTNEIIIGQKFKGKKYFSHNKKTLILNLSNLKKNYVIEYKIKKTVYKPIINNYFAPEMIFETLNPAYEVRLTIKIPKNKNLYWCVKNFKKSNFKKYGTITNVYNPSMVLDGNYKTYEFYAYNIPKISSEPYMPNIKELAFKVVCSTLKDWNEIFVEDIKYLEMNINKISNELKNKVFELTSNCSLIDEKIAKIYHYIQQEIRYISIKDDFLALRHGHSADTIFQNKYGDCTDKAILMSAMLKVINVDCYPVSINTKYNFEKEVVKLDTNHKISFVKYDSKEIFLDATSQNTRFPFFRVDNHNKNVFIPHLFKIMTTPSPISNNILNLKIQVINERDLFISGVRNVDGYFEAKLRAKNKKLKADQIKYNFNKELLKIFSNVSNVNISYSNLYDLDKPLVETFEFNALNSLIKANNLIFIPILFNELKFPEVALKKRKYPIDLKFLVNYEINYEYIIPKDYKINYLPLSLNIENNYFIYSANYVKINENIIKLKKVFKRKKTLISQREYKYYKSDVEKIIKHMNEFIVIEKVK